MSPSFHPFEGFETLSEIPDAESRKAAFRATFAGLAAVVSDRRIPAPLEGLDVDRFAAGVDVALRDGHFDTLDWLAEEVTQPTLFEMASMLPPGEAKRKLGRSVAHALDRGKGVTFAAVATQAVLASSVRWMNQPGVRARVVLSLAAPSWMLPHADALALAIVSRRELAESWLVTNSHGSLAARRTAARLLERASSEAARRAAAGDDGGARVFETPTVHDVFERLLADREPLVWRHVAVARGQLADALPSMLDEIRSGLSPRLGVTEWRRAAVSLSASAVVRPNDALAECRSLLASELPTRDRGLAGAILHGLENAIPMQPTQCGALMWTAVDLGGLEAIEALVQTARRAAEIEHFLGALQAALGSLRTIAGLGDDADEGRFALAAHLEDQIIPMLEGQRPNDMPASSEVAVEVFAESGPQAASAVVGDMLDRVDGLVRALVSVDLSTPEGRSASYRILRDLDVTLLESGVFDSLLALTEPSAAGVARSATLASAKRQLGQWLQGRVEDLAETRRHGSIELERLRALLHLVDVDAGSKDESADRIHLLRMLLARIKEPSTRVRRVLCATIARTIDALVRDDAADSVDMLTALFGAGCTANDFATLAEASMVPELERELSQAERFLNEQRQWQSTPESTLMASRSMRALAESIPVAESRRADALRMALMKLASDFDTFSTTRSIADLQSLPLQQAVVTTLQALRQLFALTQSSHRRLLEAPCPVDEWHRCLEPVDAIRRGGSPDELRAVLLRPIPRSSSDSSLASLVVSAIAAMTAWLAALPDTHQESSRQVEVRAIASAAALPAWLPLHRTLGSYFVLRPIGSGGAGTVFEARRFEERHDPSAPAYALKVPDYDEATARTLSESQFLAMFREEAAALLLLPPDPHLARLEAFDASARPKPILAMELVHGPSLEDRIATRQMNVRTAFDLLDGIASGLETMHHVGVAHLDIKPSNVIVRAGSDGSAGTPVLVDFGLAGRRIRPGCGTPNYAAPEVFLAVTDGASPSAVDVYAFCCLAYELLAGRCLFEDDSLHVLIALHFEHDGFPPPLPRWSQQPRLAPLARAIASGLRRDARARCDMGTLRAQLASVRRELEVLSWPLDDSPPSGSPT